MAKRMQMKGIVTGNKMDKTAVVEVSRKVRHPKYKKYIMRKTKIYAHTEDKLEVGTEVIVEESRPISKLKRWIVVRVNKDTK